MTPVIAVILISSALAGLLAAASGSADSGGGPDPAAFDTGSAPCCVVRIDRVLVEDMRLHDTLDLLVEAGGFEPAGCALKLATHSPFIDIVEILPGELIDSCNWDLFRARQVAPPPTGPPELWQLTVLAQGVSGRKEPLCYRFDRPASLARLVVSSVHLGSVPDTAAAIFFYWESCRDNVISDRVGASILVSDSVYDYLPIPFDTERDQFPSRYGTPPECIRPGLANPPRRLIRFHNGGVEFRVKIEKPGED